MGNMAVGKGRAQASGRARVRGYRKAGGRIFELVRAGLGLWLWWWKCLRQALRRLRSKSMDLPRVPLPPTMLVEPRGRQGLGIILWRQGKGSAALSWGPGPLCRSAEGSSGMSFLPLAPALAPFSVGT